MHHLIVFFAYCPIDPTIEVMRSTGFDGPILGTMAASFTNLHRNATEPHWFISMDQFVIIILADGTLLLGLAVPPHKVKL